MKASKSLCLQCLFTCLLLFIAARVKADDSGILDRIIRLPKSEMTVYKLLSKITEETGYLFIYDSKLVDNERTVKLKGGKQTVRQAIYSIIGNDNLKLRSVDKHIIIYRPETALSISKEEGLCRDSTLSFTLEGTLIDQLSREPIPYATVGAEGSSIGSVTNQNGVSGFICPIPSETAGFAFHIWATYRKPRMHPYLPDETELLLWSLR